MTKNWKVTVTFTEDEEEAQIAYEKAVLTILSANIIESKTS